MEAFKCRSGEKSAVTILLTHSQAARMDEVTAVIRRNTGYSISRSALIRGITAAALTMHEDWIQCRNEDDICVLLMSRFSDRLDMHTATTKFKQLKAEGAV